MVSSAARRNAKSWARSSDVTPFPRNVTLNTSGARSVSENPLLNLADWYGVAQAVTRHPKRIVRALTTRSDCFMVFFLLKKSARHERQPPGRVLRGRETAREAPQPL